MTQGRVTRLKISNQGLLFATKQAETFWEFRPNFQFLEIVFLSKITSSNPKDLFLIKLTPLLIVEHISYNSKLPLPLHLKAFLRVYLLMLTL